MNTGLCSQTRPQVNREKREKRALSGQKSGKFALPCPQGKTAGARRNRGFQPIKRGTEKICPPCVVVDGSPLRNFLFALKRAREY